MTRKPQLAEPAASATALAGRQIIRSNLETRGLAVPSQGRSGSRGRSDADEMASLKGAIACDREDVAASLGELRRRVHRALRWGRWLFHPAARMAIGLALGFIVGRRGRAKAR